MTPKRDYTDYLRDLLHCAAAQRFVAGMDFDALCPIDYTNAYGDSDPSHYSNGYFDPCSADIDNYANINSNRDGNLNAGAARGDNDGRRCDYRS